MLRSKSQSATKMPENAGLVSQNATFDLKNAMSDLGLTVDTLAETLSVSRASVIRWRTGEVETPGPVVAYMKLRQRVVDVLA